MLEDDFDSSEFLNELEESKIEEAKERAALEQVENDFSAVGIPKTIKEPAPFPLEAFEGLEIRNVVVAISNMAQTNLEVAFHSVLAAMNLVCSFDSSLIMNWRGGWKPKPISLFLVTIAESGARKTTTDEFALGGIKYTEAKLFERYENNLRPEYEADLKDYQKRLGNGERGLTKPKEPPIPTVVTSDPTMEGLMKIYISGRKSVGLISDDASQFLCGRAGQEDKKVATMATLCKFYDGETVSITQATKTPSLIKSARLTMHLMLQPNDDGSDVDVGGLYTNENKSQGILSRLLPVRVVSLDGRRELSDELDPDTDKWRECIEEYQTKCSRRTYRGLHGVPQCVEFDKASCDLLRKAYNHVEKEIGICGKYADMGRYLNKLINNLARMAATFAIWDEKKVVEAMYTEKALSLVDYYIENLREMLSGNKYFKFAGYKLFLDSLEVKIFDMEYLKERRPLKSERQLMAMIYELLEYNWIVEMDAGGEKEGATLRWAINPNLDEINESWSQQSLNLFLNKQKLK